MPWLEISLRCRACEQSRYQNALEDVDALAVTLLDADAETGDEHAILEPGVGETPLWDCLTLTALFPEHADPLQLMIALDAFDPALDWSHASWRRIDDQAWERAWMDQYEPLRFGQSTWIVPWNHLLPDAAQTPRAAVVRLDPGLAFGSGTHPTTALCLEWLDALANKGDLSGATMLDFGCGSGILALAALKLGARRAIAIDNDPQAIAATCDNATRNGVGTHLQAFTPDMAPMTTCTVAVANILASALDVLAPVLAKRVQSGGQLAISGILSGQEDALRLRYMPWFDKLRTMSKDGWVRIDGIRNDRNVIE